MILSEVIDSIEVFELTSLGGFHDSLGFITITIRAMIIYDSFTRVYPSDEILSACTLCPKSRYTLLLYIHQPS